MKQYLLGIDVGTTGTKTLLFSADGTLIGHAYRGYPLSTPHVGWSEQNPQDWWQAVVETVREVCNEQEIAQNVAAISMSLQGGTIVATDKAGTPLCPAIVWNDGRCNEEKEAFLKEFGNADRMYQATGWHLGDGLPALVIRWLREHKPEVFENAAYFLSVPDYLALKMTGIPAVDISDAGINQLCDIRRREYDEQLLSFAGIQRGQLPDILPSGTVIGNLTPEAAEELGLSENTVLVTGAHDQYAVALGAGACHDGDILIGSGTCWVVTAISENADFASGLSQSVAAVPGMWGSLQSLSSGGICLDWLRNKVSGEGTLSYEALNREVATRQAAENGLFFYPFSGKSGESTNFHTASFVGLDIAHDRFDMARAVMEGIVFQVLWMMESFRAKPGEDGIILAGGASKSPVWAQLLSDISGLPVRIPEVADLACVGAAILAGVGCGIYPDAQTGHGTLAVKERVLQPNLNRTQIYKPLFAQYKKIAEILENISWR